MSENLENNVEEQPKPQEQKENLEQRSEEKLQEEEKNKEFEMKDQIKILAQRGGDKISESEVKNQTDVDDINNVSYIDVSYISSKNEHDEIDDKDISMVGHQTDDQSCLKENKFERVIGPKQAVLDCSNFNFDTNQGDFSDVKPPPGLDRIDPNSSQGNMNNTHNTSTEKPVENSWIISDDSSMENSRQNLDQTQEAIPVQSEAVEESLADWKKKGKRSNSPASNDVDAKDHGHSHPWNQSSRGPNRGRGRPMPIVSGRVKDVESSQSNERKNTKSDNNDGWRTKESSYRATTEDPDHDNNRETHNNQAKDDDDWDTLEVQTVNAEDLKGNTPIKYHSSHIEGRSASPFRRGGRGGDYRGGRGDYNGERGSYRGGRGDYNGERGSYRGGRGDYRGERGSYRGGRGEYRGGRGEYRGDRVDYRGERGSYRGGRGEYRGDREDHRGGRSGYDNYRNDRSRSTNRFGNDRSGYGENDGRSRSPWRGDTRGRSYFRPENQNGNQTNFDSQWDDREKSPIFGQKKETGEKFWGDYNNPDYKNQVDSNQDDEDQRGGFRGRYRGDRSRGGWDNRRGAHGYEDRGYQGGRGEYRGDRGGYRGQYRGADKDEWGSRGGGRGRYGRANQDRRRGMGRSDWGGTTSRGSNYNMDDLGSETQEIGEKPFRRRGGDDFGASHRGRGGAFDRDRSRSAMRGDDADIGRSTTPDRFNRRSTSVMRSGTPMRGDRSKTPGFSAKAVADVDSKYGYVESNPKVYKADLSSLQKRNQPGFEQEEGAMPNDKQRRDYHNHNRPDYNSDRGRQPRNQRGGYENESSNYGQRGQHRGRGDFQANDFFKDSCDNRDENKRGRGRPLHGFTLDTNVKRHDRNQDKDSEEKGNVDLFKYGHSKPNQYRGGRQEGEIGLNYRSDNQNRYSGQNRRERPMHEFGESRNVQKEDDSRDNETFSNRDYQNSRFSQNQKEDIDSAPSKITRNQDQKSAVDGLGSNFTEVDLTGWDNDAPKRRNPARNYEQRDKINYRQQNDNRRDDRQRQTPFDESQSKSPKNEKQNLNDTKANFRYTPTEADAENAGYSGRPNNWEGGRDDRQKRRQMLGGDSQDILDRRGPKKFEVSEFFNPPETQPSQIRHQDKNSFPTGPPDESSLNGDLMVGNITFGDEKPRGDGNYADDSHPRSRLLNESGMSNSKYDDRSPTPIRESRHEQPPMPRGAMNRRGRGRTNK